MYYVPDGEEMLTLAGLTGNLGMGDYYPTCHRCYQGYDIQPSSTATELIKAGSVAGLAGGVHQLRQTLRSLLRPPSTDRLGSR
jgi:hypothetical protein